jgi:hypothetical protein
VRFRGAMIPHDEHTRIEPGPGEAAAGAAAASVVPQWLQKRASGGSGAPHVGQGRIPRDYISVRGGDVPFRGRP